MLPETSFSEVSFTIIVSGNVTISVKRVPKLDFYDAKYENLRLIFTATRKIFFEEMVT